MAVSVFIVDDHEVFRLGLMQALEDEGFDIVGEAGTIAEAIPAILDARPAVVIMDLRLPDGDGAVACRRVKDELPETGVLILTSFGDTGVISRALDAGASGYLLKGADRDEVVEAIGAIAEGKSLLGPTAAALVMDKLRADRPAKARMPGALTPREQKVYDLVAAGRSNREIGEALGMSEKTVKNHVTHILAKLGMKRRAQVAAHAAKIQAGTVGAGSHQA